MKLIVKFKSKQDASNKIKKRFSKNKTELTKNKEKSLVQNHVPTVKNTNYFKNNMKNSNNSHGIKLNDSNIKNDFLSKKGILKTKKKNFLSPIPVKKYTTHILEGEKSVKRHYNNVAIKNIKLRKNNKLLEKKLLKNNNKNAMRFGRNYKQKNTRCSMLQQSFIKPNKMYNRDILIGDEISISDLANKMAVKSKTVINVMEKLGFVVSSNQILDRNTAKILTKEMGHKVIMHIDNALEVSLMQDRDIHTGKIKIRSPVVTVMGHVDHGKTSLLDYIRSTKITSKEAGGITQHIGAYHVSTPHGIITFVDTPGHAAFTAMRARGATITDIVVLVVAADDGIMPQTIEAIHHAQSANVPIIVAINKIDKAEKNIEKIKKELMQHSVIAEDFGGENIFVSVSAKTGFGIDQLLSVILLQAEMLELKTEYDCMASGVVLESFLDKGCGPIATVLIKEGTLKTGDIVICGLEYGKIKAIRNEFLNNILSAGPSIPVEILGLSGVPNVGDIFIVVRNEKKAREVALYRQNKFRDTKLSVSRKNNAENLFNYTCNSKKISTLNIILKADVQGSLEAIKNALEKLSNESILINIITVGVGGITESDASLCMTSGAVLIGFNVRADALARRMIEIERLDLRYYSIIYNLIDDIKKSMLGLLKPLYKQNIVGLAEVRNIFKSPKFGLIAGCMVTEGVIKRMNSIRILRDNIVVYEGELESLRRFKENVDEVRNGTECGIGIKNYSNLRIGDLVEGFQIKTV